MRDHAIAIVPGDGIGTEVVPEAVRVLDAAAEITASFRLKYERFPWGCEYYLKHGEMMAPNGLELLRPFDAIFFGAVGFPTVPDHVSLRGLRLPICQGFEQYVCYRPSVLLPGVKSPLAGKRPGDVDFVVIRENTEGEYAGAGGRSHQGLPIEVAVQTAVFTRVGVERVVRYAFQLSRRRRKKLVSATKSNAQQHALTLWDEVAEAVGRDFPDVAMERVLIDALAARFVLAPESLDVVVASNLFGDILTDLGAAICGSMGLAPSGNINPEREYPSMFEPVHGSAPDIVGRGIANPVAQIESGAMMIEFLGEEAAAALVRAAVRAVLAEGRTLTPDLGGTARTSDVTDAVLAKLRAATG
ncbi:MAG TPA: tartrate dehydrogenase [Vicinamibacteria bacterium]|nr:tartrate dehydrogenase [Vicinamibacteria bacterium]